ncbi:type I-E CRISPR-associated protein Cse2/CasB [Streptomyces sp. NPDC003077]|uniref:type I-E CRISPR-associated protein Cse2/CasB n=1 Tax=Streptomyces sp. NPDC003077 TaxID=3154443 RepID=UPI0033B9ED91
MTTTPQTRSAASTTTDRYWAGRAGADGRWKVIPGLGPMEPPGEDLAALRSGLGLGAYEAPALWPFYTSPADGKVTPELEAEHVALSLYGLHQQSQRQPMHQQGISLGAALRVLRHSGRFREEAVDRRVAAAVNATSVPALAYRLRGLITQLRGIQQPLDYDRLLSDIKGWHHAESRRRVRRAWGLAYDAPSPHRPHGEDGNDGTSGAEDGVDGDR